MSDMTTTREIDERVVSLRFDNDQFERGTRQTLSTIEKLKSALKFGNISDGFRNIASDTSIVNKNMEVLGQGVRSVQREFDSLSVIGATALVRLTNAAIDTGKMITNALTLEPVKTGFDEYETKMGSIQTILTNTKSKGTTLDEVIDALDTLNIYADKTIYNFKEMTRNIGTFTAAGVELNTAVSSIQGIANLAAASGSNSQQASTAMYQLSQALAAGAVKLQDWNSVVNAGMGGELFQEALKETSRELGTGVDDAIKARGSFRESLREGWLTTDVLSTTLTKFTKEGAKEYAQAMMESGRYTEEQTKALMEQAEMMEDAATKVKTLTQLWDTLKETAQSGWAKTWEIIIGDFDQAKNLFTSINDVLSPWLDRISNARNDLLSAALGDTSGWQKMTEYINGFGITTKSFEKELESVMRNDGLSFDKMLKDAGDLQTMFKNGLDTEYARRAIINLTQANSELADSNLTNEDRWKALQKVVDDVWRGDYKNAPERYELLEKAGYDYAIVQDLVNQTMDHHRLTLEELTDEQLRSIGLTQEEIDANRQLNKEAKKRTGELEDYLWMLDKDMSGREVMIEGLKNLFLAIKSVIQPIAEGFKEVFASPTAVQIYKFLWAFKDFTEQLILTEGQMNTLRYAAIAVFNVFDAVRFILGTGLRLAFRIITTLLEALGLDFSGLAETLADVTGKIRDFIKENDIVGAIMQVIGPTIAFVGGKIGEFIKYLQSGDSVIPKFVDKIKEFIKNGPSLQTIGNLIKDLFSGEMFKNTKLADLFYKVTYAIRNFFEKAFDVKKINLFGGKDGESKLGDSIIESVKNAASKVSKWFKSIDFGALIAGGSSIALAISVGKTVYNITKPLGAMGRMFDSIGDMFDALTERVEQMKRNARIRNLLILAGAIFVLASAVQKIADIPSGKIGASVTSIIALTVALGVMTILITKAEKMGRDQHSSDSAFKTMMTIAVTIMLLSKPIEKLGEMDTGALQQGMKATGILFGALAMLVGAIELFEWLRSRTNNNTGTAGDAKNALGMGATLIGIGVAMLLLAKTVKIAGSINSEELTKGTLFVIAAGIIMSLFINVLVNAKNNETKGFGRALLGYALSMLILVGVIKAASKVSGEELKASLKTVGVAFAIIGLLVAITGLCGSTEAGRAGLGVLLITVAMAFIPLIFKTLSVMKIEDVNHCLKIMSDFWVFILLFTAVSKYAGTYADKAGIALLAMSGAMLILVGCVAVVGLMKEENIKRAKNLVADFMFMMMLIVAASGISKNAAATILSMTAALALLAGVLAAFTMLDKNKVGMASLLLVAVGGLLAGIMFLSRFTRTAKLGPVIALMSGVAAVMFTIIAVIGIASKIANGDPKGMALIFGSVASIILAAALMMFLIAKATTYNINLAGVAKIGALMGAVIVVMTLVALLVSAFGGKLAITEGDLNNVLPALGCAAVLILFAAGVAAIISVASSKVTNTKNMWQVAGLMGAVLVMMAAVGVAMAVISHMPINIDDTAALVGRMFAVSLMTAAVVAIALFINKRVQNVNIDKTSLLKLGAIMLGIVGLMLIVGGAMAWMSTWNIDMPFTSVISLMTAVLLICAIGLGIAYVSNYIQPMTGKIGGIVAMIAVVTGVAVIVSTFVMKSLSKIENTDGLLTKVLAFSIILAVISALAAGLAWVANIVSMNPAVSGGMAPVIGLLVTVGVIAAGVAEHVMGPLDEINNVDGLMTKVKGLVAILIALAVLALAAAGIGAIIAASGGTAVGGTFIGVVAIGLMGAVVGALATLFVKYAIPEIAKQMPNLIKIAIALQTFGDAIKHLDPEHVAAAGLVVDLLTKLSSVVDNLQWLDIFHKNWQDIITNDLVKFAECCNEFSDKLVEGHINPEAIDCASKCIEIYKLLNDNMPTTGGWSEKFKGIKDFNTFGDDLKSFATAVVGFAVSLKAFETTGVSAQQVEEFATMCLPLLDLQKKLYGTGGWKQKIFGEKDLAFFGQDLLKFNQSIWTLWNGGEVKGTTYKGIKDMDWSEANWDPFLQCAEKVINLGHIVANSGGILGEIAGNNDLDAFGETLPAFGDGLVNFNDKVSAKNWNPRIFKGVYDCMAWLGPAIEEYVPKENGWIQNVLSVGKTNLEEFSAGLGYFGEGLSKFYDAVGEETKAYRIEQAAKATTSIETVLQHMPSKDSMKKFVEKSNYMKEHNVTDSIVAYFRSISSWSADMVTINTTQLEKASTVLLKLIDVLIKTSDVDIEKLKSFPEALNGVASDAVTNFMTAFDKKEYPDVETVVGKFITKVCSYFTGRMAAFAKTGEDAIAKIQEGMLTGIDNFSKTVKTGEKDWNMATKALGEISKLIKEMPSADEWEKFEESNKYFLDNSIMANATMVFRQLSTWYSAAKDVDFTGIKNSVSSLSTIINSFSGVSDDSINDMNSVASAMSAFSSVSVESLTNALNGDLSSVTESVNNIVTRMTDTLTYKRYLFGIEGRRIVEKLIEGIEGKGGSATKAASDIASGVVREFDGITNRCNDSGENAVQGFINGMNAKRADVLDAAYDIAISVKDEVDKTLRVNSPSKVMISSGEAVSEGLALGILRASSTVTDASNKLANDTSTTLGAILADAVESFDDTNLNPVITPVLNLDEVNSGFASINDLMSSYNIGYLGKPIPAITKQASTNDVIDAISALGTALANTGGDTYNIDGITYDDGSNVSSAVQQLIYAANIARRS